MDQFQRESDDTCLGGAFTLAQLANLLNVPRQRVRAWLTAGLIEPISEVQGVRYFDFSQVAHAKILSNLAHAGIGTNRIQRSLEQIRTWSADASEPLDQLAIVEKYGHLLVRLESGLVEPSGQMCFDFGEDSTILEARPTTQEEWFQLGCQHEEDGAHDEAINAYRQALLKGGPDADTYFNLANVLYAAGHKQEASERYRQTAELDPGYAEAWNNLGVVLGELGHSDADGALRMAVDLGFDDARFNLAQLLDRRGREAEARPHWNAWMRSAPHGMRRTHAQGRVAE